MNRYLRDLDFTKQIAADQLTAIIGGDVNLRYAAEQEAIEEVISYLIQRYDTDHEFAPFQSWSQYTHYSIADRVLMNQSVYVSTTIYVIGDIVSQTVSNVRGIYKANATTTGTFNTADWDYICTYESIFYSTYPFPLFDITKPTAKDDTVVFKGVKYQAKKDTYGFVPLDKFGQTHDNWTLIGAAETLINVFVDTGYWTEGDNRSSELVMFCVDIALYHLYSRINPRKIQQLRLDRYDHAIKKLEAYASGKQSPNILEKYILNETVGMPISWGSAQKNINLY